MPNPTPSLSATSVTSIALTVSTSASTDPKVYRHDIPVEDITMGDNRIWIPLTSDVHKGFLVNDVGTAFVASLETSHDNGSSIVKSTSSSLFTPNPITTQVSLTPIVAKYGDTPISLTDYVTTNSKGVVTYTIGDTSIANVSLDGNKLNILKAGNTTIYAKQTAFGLYLSAVSNIVPLIINPIAQTYTFDNKTITNGGQFAMSSQNVGVSPYTVTPSSTYPTSNSMGAYSYASSDTTVASVDIATGVITVKNAGTTTITVSQAAAGNYISGYVQASLVVNPIAQTFTFDNKTITNGGQFTMSSQNVGASPFTITPSSTYPTSNSTGAYSYASSDTTVATVNSTTGAITVKNAGTTIITVSQAAAGNYISGYVQASLVVNTIAPTFKIGLSTITNGGQFTISSQNVRASPFTITPTPTYPTSNSTGAYSYASSDTTVATVNSTTGAITVKNAGTTIITVSQAAAGNYISGYVQASLVVNTIAPTFTFGGEVIPTGGKFTITSPTPGATTFRPTYPISNSTGAYSYVSSNMNIATVSTTGDITIKSVGTVNIIVTQAATNNYISRSVNGSLQVMYKWVMQGQDINGEIANDQSGTSVSLSADGTIVAVGAPYNNGNGSDSGHVRVYKLISNTWTKQGGDIDGEDDNDKSGTSVSLSRDGSIVAIGSPKNNNSNGTDAGNVRVFKYNANKTTANSLGPVGWDQLGGDINGENANDESGTSVSISDDGTIVAIGAPNNNGNGNGTKSGQVCVYKLISNKWTQIGGDINGENANDESGTSVSISDDGTIVAIGAPNNNGNGNGTKSGQVCVYKLISNKWTQIGGDINGEAANDESGTSVSLSKDGSMVAVGAPNNNGNGSDSGHVRVFKLISNKWTQQGGDINGEAANDESGSSVSLSGDGLIVAIGGPKNNGIGTDAGHVRVYKLISNKWIKQDGDIDGEAPTDESGRSVSISRDGLIVAIGAPNNNSNESGHVRVYKYMLSA